jgi:EmrB/QacA subfamily drug resistance transporter
LDYLEAVMNSNLRRWIALVVVCLGQLMIMVDTTIVNVALPYIQRDLNFSQASLTWVVNAYLIAYGSFLLVAGRFGDLIGRRKVFLAGVFLFTVASVGTGFAQGAGQLVTGRFLQGLGGSLTAGVIIAIIITEFQKPAERAQAMSVFTLVIAGGGSLGLLAGGFLIQWLNWHWIFFINLPIGVITLVLGAWLIEENEGLGLTRGVDVLGSVLVTAALMLGVYGIVTASDSGWSSAHTIGFGGAAIALLAAFLVLEWRLSNPIMPLRVLTSRSLTGASVARAFLFAGMFTNFFIGALYLQHIHGFSAFTTGLAFLPTTLVIGVLSAGVSRRLMARFGPRNLLVAGMTIIVAGLAVLSQAGPDASYFPTLFIAYLLLGSGAGTSFLPLLTISMSEVAPADAGLASGFSNVTMQVGGALGLAALGTISTDHAKALFAQGYPMPVALTGGYQLGFVLAAVSVAAGLAVVLTVLRGARPAARRQTPATADVDETEVEAA